MPVICPKCSHVRPADAANPDWQCPACGICYAKFGAPPTEPQRPAREPGAGARHSWDLGMLFKIVLLVVLGWGLNYAIQRRQNAEPEEAVAVAEQPRSGDGAGVAFADAVLKMSEVDATVLRTLPDRLEESCGRNKYRLSAQECRTRIHERDERCQAQVAQRYPGQIGNTERMAAIVNGYMHCVFEQ